MAGYSHIQFLTLCFTKQMGTRLICLHHSIHKLDKNVHLPCLCSPEALFVKITVFMAIGLSCKDNIFIPFF